MGLFPFSAVVLKTILRVSTKKTLLKIRLASNSQKPIFMGQLILTNTVDSKEITRTPVV